MIVTDAYRTNYSLIEWSPLPPRASADLPISVAPISGHLREVMKLLEIDDWAIVVSASDKEILSWPNVGKAFLRELRRVQPYRVVPRNVAPYVISDTMEPTMHMATGQVLDSKHKFRQITREHGLDEVGNEKMMPRTPTTVPRPGPDIKRAIEELRGR